MKAIKRRPITHPTAEIFNRHFDPKGYLRELFSTPDDEDRFSITFIAKMLKSLPVDLSMHEFGGGPTLYSVAALAPKAREIHFSDVVDASLREVELWLKGAPEAHDWTAYIALALQAEGLPSTPESIEERASRMRRLITRLMHCDGQANIPIELKDVRYDLVSAHHCTDVAVATVSEWVQVIKKHLTNRTPGRMADAQRNDWCGHIPGRGGHLRMREPFYI